MLLPQTSPPPPAPENSNSSDDEDVHLMRLVGTGDQAALRLLIRKWQGPLVNFFFRSVQSRETAEDLAQMTFVRVYRAAARYEAKAKFSTYLFHIGRKLMINEFRRQKRKPSESIDPADIDASVSGREPLELMEIEEAFSKAIADLPENQRSALLLLKQQELSYEQISDIMGASIPSVKTWIHRARTLLKDRLKDVFER